MTMEDIDFRLMGSLKALLEEVSVTRAAERLHVTQPSMSKKLKQLREMFRRSAHHPQREQLPAHQYGKIPARTYSGCF